MFIDKFVKKLKFKIFKRSIKKNLLNDTMYKSTGNKFFGAMDASTASQTEGENGAPAVSSGPYGGAVQAQSEQGQRLLALLTDAFGGDTRGKTRETVEMFVRTYFGAISDGSEEFALELLAVYVANLRDVRHGKRERDLAYWVILEIAKFRPDLVRSVLHLFVQEYGSFGDLHRLYVLADSEDKNVCLLIQDSTTDIFCDQLVKDDLVVKSGDGSLSLAGKHAPRIKGTKGASTATRLRIKMGRQIALKILVRTCPSPKHFRPDGSLTKEAMNFAEMSYREMNSRLNERLQTVEVGMCSGKWDEIDPGKVPACALHKYRRSLDNINKDGSERSTSEVRRVCAANFEAAKKKCIETGKGLHGTVKGAHGIVRPIVRGCDGTYEEQQMAEAMWKNLITETREKFAKEGGLPSCVAMVDVSLSMDGIPMEVAVALGLVVAETSPTAWRDRVLTFHTTPTWHKIRGETLRERVKNLMSAEWGGTTDFEAALNLVLAHAVEAGVAPEAMPEVFFVFSDMQFNRADGSSGYYGHSYYRDGAKSSTGFLHAHASIQKAFREAGYECPHIVFWNLRGECTARPCETISPGVSQMSGYSEAMLSAFMSGKLTEMETKTPCDLMMEVLDDKRYDPMRDVVRHYFGAGMKVHAPDVMDGSPLCDHSVRCSRAHATGFAEDAPSAGDPRIPEVAALSPAECYDKMQEVVVHRLGSEVKDLSPEMAGWVIADMESRLAEAKKEKKIQDLRSQLKELEGD